MKLTPEQLLQPRYKAIADYPGAIYKKGYIINCRDDLQLGEFCKKHPDVFRSLQWWQERPLNEMPEYVKGTIDNKVAKVFEWNHVYYVGISRFEEKKPVHFFIKTKP